MSGTFLNKNKLFFSIFSILFIFASFAFADPRVVSVSMVPPNPGFGDSFVVKVTYCAQGYNDAMMDIAVSSNAGLQSAALTGIGQVFVVYGTKTGNCAPMPPTSQPSSSPGGEIGCLANVKLNADLGQCTVCPSGSGNLYYREYTVRVPDAENFPGCTIANLYLHVGMKDANLNESEWATRDACTSESLTWAMPPLQPGFSIRKRAEGVLQDVGDLVVFAIDFTYQKGILQLTDSMPPYLKLVAYGPTTDAPYVTATGPVIGTVGPLANAFTWTFKDRSGDPTPASGSVWMLYSLNTDPGDGVVINNTAQGKMGATTKPASTNVKIGSSVMTLKKSAEQINVPVGTDVTYYLDYSINGDVLKAFQPFDNFPKTSYTDPTPPTGWQFRSEGGKTGTWTIEDQCGTGDRAIRGTMGSTNYPGLLYSGYNFCLGTITTDVMINPGNEASSQGYEGSDALVIIRDNGKTAPGDGRAYGLVISIDENPGGVAGGNMSIQECVPGCTWAATSVFDPPFDIVANKWYVAKIEATSDCTFRYKVWPKGDAEPGWQKTYTAATCIPCTDPSGPFYSGFGEQGGAKGVTEDIYNNFIITAPRTSASVHLYDTVPLPLTYLGQSGPHTLVGGPPVLDWNLADLAPITNESGSFTWWARVTTCDPITNTGDLISATAAGVRSNEVVIYPVCPEISSITKTANVPLVVSGDTVTWYIAYKNNGLANITNYTITDTWPPYMNALGCLAPAGSCTFGNPVKLTIPLLAPGASGIFTWWGRVTYP